MVFASRPFVLLCLTLVSFNLNAQATFNNGGNSFGAAAILGTNDNYPLHIYTNGVNRMTIGTNGFLGIGTTNPTIPIQIESTSNNASMFLRTTYWGASALVQVNNGSTAFVFRQFSN